MPDTTNAPGDTLEDNVRYLLQRCPYRIRDMSGDRTGSRGVEDLAGTLAITMMRMEEMIRDLAEEVSVADKLLAERNKLLDAIPGCRSHGTRCVPHAIEWVEKIKGQGFDALVDEHATGYEHNDPPRAGWYVTRKRGYTGELLPELTLWWKPGSGWHCAPSSHKPLHGKRVWMYRVDRGAAPTVNERTREARAAFQHGLACGQASVIEPTALLALIQQYAAEREEVAIEAHCYPGDSWKNKQPAADATLAQIKAALGVHTSDGGQHGS